MTKRFRPFALLPVFWLLHSSTADAAGYALIEQSASGMGNAFAGAAVTAEDASTVYFNPAGMAYLPDSQLVLSGHAIRPSAEFSNRGSQRSPASGGLPTPGNNGGDPGDWAFLPNVYFAQTIHPAIKLGLGVNAPFGLKSSYASGWVGRYQALKSELKTVNINPSIAFKATDWLSLGVGFSAMWMQAELSNAVDFGSLLGAPQARDGHLRLTGDSWGWGWNVGAIAQITQATRFGLAYRSQVEQTLQGHARFSNVPPALAALFPDGAIKSHVTTPASLSLSLLHQLNPQWDVMADVTWTDWRVFQDFTVSRSSGNVLATTPEHWRDSVRAAVGTSFQVSSALKLRGGVAYDASPVPSAYRTPRIPDSDRLWLSLGVAYHISPASRVDLGYTHIFVMDAAINKTTDTSVAVLRDTLQGGYDSQLDIISVQLTQSF